MISSNLIKHDKIHEYIQVTDAYWSAAFSFGDKEFNLTDIANEIKDKTGINLLNTSANDDIHGFISGQSVAITEARHGKVCAWCQDVVTIPVHRCVVVTLDRVHIPEEDFIEKTIEAILQQYQENISVSLPSPR